MRFPPEEPTRLTSFPGSERQSRWCSITYLLTRRPCSFTSQTLFYKTRGPFPIVSTPPPRVKCPGRCKPAGGEELWLPSKLGRGGRWSQLACPAAPPQPVTAIVLFGLQQPCGRGAIVLPTVPDAPGRQSLRLLRLRGLSIRIQVWFIPKPMVLIMYSS